MTDTCESCGMARHKYGLNGCVNLLLHEGARLHTEVERLRAIVRDLADCDVPGDYETGDCVLCGGVYEHEPSCPYRRALDFMGSTP